MSSRDAPNTINSSQPRSEMDNTVRRQPLPQQTSDLLCHHQHPNLQHHRQVEHYCDQQQQVDHRASLGSFGRAQGNAAHPSTTMSMETMSHTRGQRNDRKSGDQSTPMAATTPPTSTSRTAMSQKRQNIMQRRIEMRRRNEERQKQLQLQRDEHERQTQHQHEPYRRQIGSQDVKWNDCGYQHQESHCSVENDNTTARKVGRQSRPISKRIVNNHHLHSRKMHQNVPPSQKDYKMKPDHYQQNHPHYPINQSFYHPSNPIHNKFMNQDITSQKASTTDADQRITHTKSRESEQQIQEQSRVVSPVVEYQSNNFTKFPHSNSNFDRQHFNSRKYHEDYGPYHNESPSPIVQSPPVLQRTQQSQNYNANPEGVFDGNYFSEQYLSDDGGPSSYQRSAQSASRIVSPNESPSDEGFGIRGARSHRLGKGVTSASMTNQHQHHLHSDDYDEQQIKRPCGKQSNNLLPMQQNFQSNQRHQNHQNQEQPDWHEINRQHIYQKQLTVRQQRLQSEQPQCVSNQSHQHNPSAPPPCQVPLKNNAPYFQRREHPSYFSPVEALDKRNDQIQRKTKMTIKKPHSINNGANRNSHLPKSQLNNHGNIDEDTISVSDRARKYLDAHGHAREGPLQYESTDSHWNDASNSYHLREPSKFPRPNGGVHRNEGQGKASRRLISQSSLKYSEQSYPERAPKNTSQSSRYLSLFDEETVSGSVASLKREWEERAANNYQNDSSHQPYHEGKNFNCMLEGKADYSRYLRQRGQRRTIDEKTRRKDVRSLPPERRNNQDNIERTGKFCHGIDRVHRDGYQSDGPGRGDSIRPPHHRSHESDNSTPLSVKDARRRLWDQNEKLRAWLPKSGSFESSGDARDRSTGNSASPGDMSGSSGSALFKSKFVHAAAVAAKKRANFDPLPNKNNEAISKYPTPKSAAVSSHLTDSTAETTAITTPAGSNGSSYRTQSNVARRRDHSKLSVHQEFEPNEFLDENSNLSNNCTAHPLLKSSNMIPEEIDDDVDFDLPHHSHQPPQIAPLLDERPRSSVSDLIAKLNAVSRANPAQALATIDSILRAECGRTPEQNDEGIVSSAQNTLREIRSNCTSGRASSPVRQPLGEDFFREHRNNSDLGKMHDIVDDPEQDSQLSSDDSTVSSMTNPTYQSMGETANNLSVNSKLAKSQRIPLSRSIVSSHARAHNTGRQSPILPPTYKTESCKSTKGLIESNRRESKYKQEHPDSKKSSHTNEISAPSDKHSDCCITSSIDDVYSDGKQSKNGGSSTRRTSSHKQYSPAIREHSLTEARSDAFDSNWESVPHSNFFSSAREVFASANNRQGSNIDDLTKREKGWRNQHSESNDARIKSIKYSFPSQQAQSQATHTSFPETDDDRFSLLPHVISDAFSNVDISLDEAPRLQTSNAPNESRSIEGPSSSLQTISHAFSDVDISLDHMKTVKQRKKELESLSKPSASKGLNDNTDGRKNERKNGTIYAAESPPTWLNQDDGKDTSDTGKSKPRKLMEPKLRLKGNTKLTQKFARLMKAFEDDY